MLGLILETQLITILYKMTLDKKKFELSLDVLSRFFIDPLFDPVYVDKEINAVHSEFEGTFVDEEKHF